MTGRRRAGGVKGHLKEKVVRSEGERRGVAALRQPRSTQGHGSNSRGPGKGSFCGYTG